MGHPDLSDDRNPLVVTGAAEGPPLVTDLDGTLVVTDTLLEGAISLIRRRPWLLPWLAVWLSRGKAVLKSEIAARCALDPEKLPYRPELVEYLRAERNAGRCIVLATAAQQTTAEGVAACLGLFDLVLASSDSVNLKGALKRDELIRRFGLKGFDYIGDSRSDAPVWAACRIGHVAGSMHRLPNSALSGGAVQGRTFPGPAREFRTLLRAIRVHQWVKNLLVFVPPILNRYVDWEIFRILSIAFLSFSFVASGTYLSNDLFDLAADRQHPRKRKRALASGQLSIAQGIALAACLVGGGFLLSLAVSGQLTVCLLIYLVLTTLYSSFLKGKPIIDVIVLAILYTLRVYTGGLVSGAYVSPWLFQFSIFLFLSLAFVKRYSELLGLRQRREHQTPGRGYRFRDLSVISQAGVGSGLLAGLVLALYVNGQENRTIYPHPEMLWGICPLFVYWIIRIWLVAHRGNMHDDPILFAFRDKVSYIVGFLIVVAAALGLTPYVWR
jgi:4-hydroxybenzoate polyprenyltransferase/phosphoserine phosphatase